MSATNDSIPAVPDDVNKPPPGVILPPKDIRAIVEKTAGYVARNGIVFEDRVRDKEQNNPKFSFLNVNDAYAPFYQWRLTEIREGRGTTISAGRPGESAVAPEPEAPMGPEQPPEFHFSARMPIINAQDLEVVKLTALYVAKRGKSFMTALSQREARNYQFDFLRPQHSLYQFFTRLVDHYTILLRSEGLGKATTEKQRIQELEHNVRNKYHVLERAKKRAEWVKYQEQQKIRKEEEEEQERIAYAQIDWHDFVVVETVLFAEADDHTELPPPTSLNDLQSASLEQKAMISLNPLRIEEAMPTGDEAQNYYNAYPVQPQTMHIPIQPSVSPSFSTAPVQPPPHPAIHSSAVQKEDQQGRDLAESGQQAAATAGSRTSPAPGSSQQAQPMRIRPDYIPRAQQARRLNTSTATSLCPNCHQQIPDDQLERHMHIELLDPRWKEQRAKAESRAATTNLSTADVANNLKRLASQRSDVFDSSLNGSLASSDQEEEARRKRLATGAVPPGYEGAPGGGPHRPTVGPMDASPNPQSLSIDDQLKRIRELHGPR